MVCLGNICRSPLAQGVLESLVDSNRVLVDSAGTGAYHIGKAPDPRSIHIAHVHGLDISQQRARQFTQNDFEEFDHILVMDRDNLRHVLAMAAKSDYKNKVTLLLDHSENSIEEVPDPYYGEEDGFQRVYDLVREACEKFAQQLNTSWN